MKDRFEFLCPFYTYICIHSHLHHPLFFPACFCSLSSSCSSLSSSSRGHSRNLPSSVFLRPKVEVEGRFNFLIDTPRNDFDVRKEVRRSSSYWSFVLRPPLPFDRPAALIWSWSIFALSASYPISPSQWSGYWISDRDIDPFVPLAHVREVNAESNSDCEM